MLLYIIHVMNDNLSQHELDYKPRWLADKLREAVKHHQVVVLTGARQVGKSTLLRNEPPFAEWHYINLDNYELLAQAHDRPETLWIDKNNIIIDEVQKAPKVLEAVKEAVDSDRGRRFVLSGSSNLLLMKQVSESLAGRSIYFTLNPICYTESRNIPFAGNLEKVLNGRLPDTDEIVIAGEHDPTYHMWKGFMAPLLEMDSEKAILQWWDGYVATYLERDLRQISQIDSLPDFRRVMTALALRTGHVLNQSAVANDLKISQPTIHRYINLLEMTYLMQRLPAFTVNRNKRLIKSPKVMWNDPGLASFLCGNFSPSDLRSSTMTGSIFESMIYMHLNTEIQLMSPFPKLYYWRTSTGNEVDFIIEWGRKIAAVEVKLADQVRQADLNDLRLFMEEYPKTIASIVVYTGDEIKRMDKNIIAIPWYLL